MALCTQSPGGCGDVLCSRSLLLSLILICLVTIFASPAFAKTPSRADLAAIDKQISELEAEVANQRRVASTMSAMIKASYRSGGRPPDPKRLQAMGQAGTGVTGAGKTKAKSVQKMISEYESLLNTRNYKGVGRLYNRLLRERRELVAKYKSKHGLASDQLISKSTMDREILPMALGRAYFANEVARSREFISDLQARIAQLRKNRSDMLQQIEDEEAEQALAAADAIVAQQEAEREAAKRQRKAPPSPGQAQPLTTSNEPSPEDNAARDAERQREVEARHAANNDYIIKTVTTEIERLLSEISAELGEYNNSCSLLAGAAHSPKGIDIEGISSSIINPAITRASELKSQLEARTSIARNLAGPIERASRKAQEHSATACSEASAGKRAEATAAGTNARNHAALAEQLAKEANAQLTSLKSKVGSNVSTLPGREQIRQQILGAVHDKPLQRDPACKLFSLNGNTFDPGGTGLQQKLSSARELIAGLSKAIQQNRDAARALNQMLAYSSFNSTYGTLQGRFNAAQPSCQSNFAHARRFCTGLTDYREVNTRLDGYAHIYQQVQAARTAAVAQSASLSARINAATIGARSAAETAQQCIQSIKPEKPEDKKPPYDVSAVNRAIANCDVSLMQRYRPQIALVAGVAAGNLLSRLDTNLSICREKKSVQRCRANRGINYAHTPNGDGTWRCTCRSGYEPARLTRKCVAIGNKSVEPAKKPKPGSNALTRAEANRECNRINKGSGWEAGVLQSNGRWTCRRTKAGRNAWCRAKGGKGYYAGKTAKDGTFSCIPTRKTANRWCRNNKGKGWYAVNIRRDGSYKCRRSEKQRRATARADCRRQVRRKGRVYAYTSFTRETYTCHSCPRGHRYRKGKCYARGAASRGSGGKKTRFKPRYRCTYRNPDGSLLGGGGSTSTVITSRRIRGARCVRIR